MLEKIHTINDKLDWKYTFILNDYGLLKKECIYPNTSNDYHTLPLIGIMITKEILKINHYINTKVFTPMLNQTVNDQSVFALVKTFDVRIRISINMINKLDLSDKVKNTWIEHIQNLYKNRLKACMDYYINTLPF